MSGRIPWIGHRLLVGKRDFSRCRANRCSDIPHAQIQFTGAIMHPGMDLDTTCFGCLPKVPQSQPRGIRILMLPGRPAHQPPSLVSFDTNSQTSSSKRNCKRIKTQKK